MRRGGASWATGVAKLTEAVEVLAGLAVTASAPHLPQALLGERSSPGPNGSTSLLPDRPDLSAWGALLPSGSCPQLLRSAAPAWAPRWPWRHRKGTGHPRVQGLLPWYAVGVRDPSRPVYESSGGPVEGRDKFGWLRRTTDPAGQSVPDPAGQSVEPESFPRFPQPVNLYTGHGTLAECVASLTCRVNVRIRMRVG